jgi:NTP pyrophosphatase (non-canonical NTP hydrolase)|tara:strand:- start:10763 stop:11521 length:759 start_codon:yes stop_codon:yes gene_type:complete
MYYIYHIPGIKKIGCTTDLKKRVEIQQGFNKKDYTVLYTTNSIKKASLYEFKEQLKYKYKTDNNNYITIKTKNMKTTHVTDQTVSFKVNKKAINKDYFKGMVFDLPKLGVIEMNNDGICKWAYDNLQESFKVKGTYFLYCKALYNAYKVFSFGEDENIYNKIRSWAQDRGIYEKGDSKTQFVKLQEESGELAKALLKKDRAEIIDAIGDIVVVLTNLAKLEKLNIEDCIESAYNVICQRKGKMLNGTFVKNE